MTPSLGGPTPDRPWGRDGWVAVLARLTDGFVRSIPADGSPAAAALPGASVGDPVPSIEGFARMSVAWAAWLREPTNPASVTWQGRSHDVEDLLASGLRDATDPRGTAWWGPIGDRDQRIVEAAEVATAIFLGGSRLRTALDRLDAGAFDRVLDWIAGVDGRDVWPDNWVLFPMLSRTVRRAAGRAVNVAEIDRAIDGMLARDAGDGWTRDGAGHALDLYSGWAIQWHLLWWAAIDGGRRPAVRRRIVRRARAWLRFVGAAVADDGSVPRFGRSLGYRFGIAAPFAQAALLGIDPLPPGVARRLSGAIIGRSLAEGAIDDRTDWLRVGVADERPEVVERYVSAGAVAWAAHALVALGLPPGDPFWTAAESEPDVRRGGLTLAAPRAGLLVARRDGATVIHNARTGHPADIPGHDYAASYGKLAYRSGHPFDVPVRPGASAGSDDALVASEGRASGGTDRLAHRNESAGGGAGPGWIRATYLLPTARPVAVRTVVLVLDGVEVRVSRVRSRGGITIRDGGATVGGDDPRDLSSELDERTCLAIVGDGHRVSAIRALVGFDRAGSSTASPARMNLVAATSAHPWVEATLPGAGVRLLVSALLAGPSEPGGVDRLRAVRLTSMRSDSVVVAGGDRLRHGFIALGRMPPTAIELAGHCMSGPAVRVAIAAEDGSSFAGERLMSIDGVVRLARAGVVRLERDAGATTIDVSTTSGIAIDRAWAASRPRWVRIGDGWGFGPRRRLAEPGVVPDGVVRGAIRRAGTSLITLRLER